MYVCMYRSKCFDACKLSSLCQVSVPKSLWSHLWKKVELQTHRLQSLDDLFLSRFPMSCRHRFGQAPVDVTTNDAVHCCAFTLRAFLHMCFLSLQAYRRASCAGPKNLTSMTNGSFFSFLMLFMEFAREPYSTLKSDCGYKQNKITHVSLAPWPVSPDRWRSIKYHWKTTR